MFLKNKKKKSDYLTIINENDQINNDIHKNEKKVSNNIFTSIQKKINNKSQQNKINKRLNEILKKYFNVNEESEIISNEEIATPKSPFKIFRNSIDALSQSNLLSNNINSSYLQSENSSVYNINI